MSIRDYWQRLRYAKGNPPATPSTPDNLALAAVSSLGASYAQLTPASLSRIIRTADAGDPRAQAALFATILEKEPIIPAHLQTRRLAVLSRPWRIQSDTSPDEADRMTAAFRTAGLNKAISWLLDATFTGYAGVTVDWAPGAASITGFRPIQPDRWVFDEAGNPALATDVTPIPLASFHPANIIYLANTSRPGPPSRAGIMRTLLWLHLFKYSSFREWNRYLERYGMPFLLGKISEGDFNDAVKRTELLNQLLEVRSGGAGIGTTGTEMQTLSGTSSGSNDAYESHQRYCDQLMTLVILGQLASSDRSSGLSSGGMQEEVRKDILEADCAMVTQAIQHTLVDWYAKLTLGLDDHDMQFIMDSEDAEDLNIKAERDARIAMASGLPLSREYAQRTYGVELDPGNG